MELAFVVISVVWVAERVIVSDFAIEFLCVAEHSSPDPLGETSWRRLISDVAGRLGILVYSIVSRFGGASGMLQVYRDIE